MPRHSQNTVRTERCKAEVAWTGCSGLHNHELRRVAPRPGPYEATFRQNEIDVSILPALIEAYLEKLGVQGSSGI
jgi:hypothetical protein